MKINFILSDTTRKATSSAIFDAVKKAKQDLLSKVILIVPETKSIIIERELLDKLDGGATANIFVYSFVRLLSRLGGIRQDKVVSKQACVVLIRKIIDDNVDNFVCYKKSCKFTNFAEKVYDTIAQFKSSDILPEDLAAALPNLSESLKAKMTDLLLIYQEYQKLLGEKLFDECDRLNLLTELAKNDDTISNSEIFVVGFDNITYEMERVLKQFAIYAKSITFSCCYFNPERSDSYIQKNDLYNKFKHIADSLKQPYNPIFYKSFEKGDFYNIANNLFLPKKVNAKSNGSVKIFKANSKKEEISFVVNSIINDIKSGKRYKDIGLYACDLENNYSLIEQEFKLANIPCFINISHNLSNHFLVNFIESAIKIFISNFSKTEVIKLIASPLFYNNDISAFINYIKSSGLNYKAILNISEQTSDNENDNNTITTLVKMLNDFNNKFEKLFSGKKLVKSFLQGLEELFNYFDIDNKIEDISKKQKDLERYIDSELSLSALAKCRSFMQLLNNFMGENEVSAEEFLQIFLSGIGTTKINLSPVSIDCVIVQNNTDGFYNIKNLYVFDCSDGKFPIKLDDKGILVDSELIETKSFIKNAIEPTVSEINARENFKAFETTLLPTEKLVLSYSIKADGGVVGRPSRILLRLLDLFGEDILTSFKQTGEFYNNKVAEIDIAGKIGEYFESGQGISEIKKNISKIKLGENFKNYLKNLEFGDKKFILNNASDLYFYENKSSISQFETYFDCPYKFFGTYGLKLKENKDASLSSLGIGTIIHRVVELFSREINKFNMLNGKAFDEEINRLLEIALNENSVSLSNNAAVINLLKIECKNLCLGIVKEQQQSGFKIYKTEFEFNKNEIVLKLNGGKEITIQGKIDRIDKMGEHLRLIDYKTGNIESKIKDIYFGNKIQLASYYLAAKNLGDKSTIGLLYYPIHSDYDSADDKSNSHYKMQGLLIDNIDILKNMDYSLSEDKTASDFVSLKIRFGKDGELLISRDSSSSKKFLKAEDFENIANYVKSLITLAAGEILEGNIEPSPIATGSDGLEKCEYCKFKGYCGLENAKFSNGRNLDGEVTTFSFCNKNSDSSEGGKNEWSFKLHRWAKTSNWHPW